MAAPCSPFQMPCKLAAIVPGRLLPISRYRPNWKYSAERPGSSTPFLSRARRSSVGSVSTEAFVGRRRQFQVHPAEQLLVIGQVPGSERGVRLGSASQVLRTNLSRIATAIIRRGDQQKSRCIGVGNNQIAAGDLHLAAFVHGAQDCAELHAGRLQVGFFGFEFFSRQSRVDPETGVRYGFAVENHTVRRAVVVWLSCERVSVA